MSSQPQLHTITPYSQEKLLTGSISIWQYQKNNFLLPEAIMDCNAGEFVDDPEESAAPSYEIRLAPGRYRITAHDLDYRCQYHKELTITPQSPPWIDIGIGPEDV